MAAAEVKDLNSIDVAWSEGSGFYTPYLYPQASLTKQERIEVEIVKHLLSEQYKSDPSALSGSRAIENIVEIARKAATAMALEEETHPTL